MPEAACGRLQINDRKDLDSVLSVDLVTFTLLIILSKMWRKIQREDCSKLKERELV